MRILLSTSPHVRHSAVLESDFQPRNDLMYSFAPLGLLMISAAIRNNLNITPIIYDINDSVNSDEITNDDLFYESASISILKNKPDIIGFMTECDSFHHILQICQEIKKNNPTCLIVLGGPHATAVAEATMRNWKCIDAIVLGEGEITFTQLVQEYLTGNISTIDGAYTRNSSGDFIKGKDRELIGSLDELPFPAYDLYSPTPGEELFLEVGRGCPFQCTFCSTSPYWQRKHRVKSPKRIVKEIQYLQGLHKDVKRIHFTHDLFTANKEWVSKVCKELIESKIDLKWTCSSRIDTIDKDLINLMSRAGCNAIYFGIESGSKIILEKIKKDISFSETFEIVRNCLENNITPNAGLILGFPDETKESFEETLSMYHKLSLENVKPLHLFSFCPFAQSSIYKTINKLEFSGHFLDIPLTPKLEKRNREIIASNEELFSSYYRPQILNIPNLTTEKIYAIDEFSILADAMRLPFLIIAEKESIKTLFFDWLEFISKRNSNDKSKPEYRKYMGSPIDFCDYLLFKSKTISSLLPWVEDLLLFMKKNFEVSRKLCLKRPISMESYRSKNHCVDLINMKFESHINNINIIELLELDYNILALANEGKPINIPPPKNEKTFLIWHLNSENNISLIQVNHFLYYLLNSTFQKGQTVKDLINYWEKINTGQSINVADLLGDINLAATEKLIDIN